MTTSNKPAPTPEPPGKVHDNPSDGLGVGTLSMDEYAVKYVAELGALTDKLVAARTDADRDAAWAVFEARMELKGKQA